MAVAVAVAVGCVAVVGGGVTVSVGVGIVTWCACASCPASTTAGVTTTLADIAGALVVALTTALVVALAVPDAAGCAGVRVFTNAIVATAARSPAAAASSAMNVFDTPLGFAAPSCVSPHVTDVPPDTITRADDPLPVVIRAVPPTGGRSLCHLTVDAIPGATKCVSALISSAML